MKIAIVRQNYTPFGGAERFTDRALQALAEQGAQVSVIARKWNDGGSFPVHTCKPFHLGRTWRDRAFARCVCNRVDQGDFDLVQSHERIACCDIYRAGDGLHREWLKERGRVSSTAQRLSHRLSPYHRYVLAAEDRLFNSPRLKAVICNSALIRDEICHHFPNIQAQLPVLYNGVDTQQFSPSLKQTYRQALRRELNVDDRTPVFLFVGAGYLRKGLAMAIRAVQAIPGAQLWIVGKDKQETHYRQQARQAGAEAASRIRFLGPQKDVTPYYGAADGLILPTLYDPFPNVILEAMACGLPVVTTLKCGAVDIIKQGQNGYVHDALDADAMVGSLQALEDPAKRERIGNAARDTVADWTLERVAHQAQDLYDQLMASGTTQT